MKIYGISGLGADKRAFQFLTLACEFIPIDWIDPLRTEHIEDYSLRLSKLINQDEDFAILGVSFGGLIAAEISKTLNNSGCKDEIGNTTTPTPPQEHPNITYFLE